MIASPYSIPSSKKAPEVTGAPYYVPTATAPSKTGSKTVNTARDNRASSSGSKQVMGISREPTPAPSTTESSSSSLSQSGHESFNSGSSGSVIYVPVPVSTTPVPAKPFGAPLVQETPVAPSFSVHMKNDKRK